MIVAFIVIVVVVIAAIVLTRYVLKGWEVSDRVRRELLLGCKHPEDSLVDVRSSVLAPNELVATLCTACDTQLGPEVWQKKLDRELAALEPPKPAVYTAKDVWVDIKPDLSNWQPARAPREDDPRYYSPMRSWSADDFRRWDWIPSFKESNFDHSEQKYVLPFYRRRVGASPQVYKLSFHSAAAARGWWASSVAYASYEQHRKVQERFNSDVRVDQISEPIRRFQSGHPNDLG